MRYPQSVLNLRPLAKLDPKRFTQQGEEDEDDDDDEDYDCSFDLDGGAAARAAAAAAAAAANPDQQQGKPTDAQEGHSPLSPNNRNNSSSNLSVASNTTTDSKSKIIFYLCLPTFSISMSCVNEINPPPICTKNVPNEDFNPLISNLSVHFHLFFSRIFLLECHALLFTYVLIVCSGVTFEHSRTKSTKGESMQH